MRNRNITVVGLVLVLSLASLSFKCGGGCADNDSRCTAARAADGLAKTIGELNNVKRELARQGKITPAEELKLTQQLLSVNTADKALVNKLKTMSGTPGSGGGLELKNLFGALTKALEDLDVNGIPGLGNADAKGKLGTLITTAKGFIPIIQSFIDAS
jgi:hypothetical protein